MSSENASRRGMTGYPARKRTDEVPFSECPHQRVGVAVRPADEAFDRLRYFAILLRIERRLFYQQGFERGHGALDYNFVAARDFVRFSEYYVKFKVGLVFRKIYVRFNARAEVAFFFAHT